MKKVLSFIAIFTFSLSINSNVKAEEQFITTVDKKYSISVEAEHDAGADLTLTLNGAEDINNDNVYYYVYFSNDANTVPTDKVTVGSFGCDIEYSGTDYSKFKNVFKSGEIFIDDDWYMLKDYNYAYVLKEIHVPGTGSYCEFSNNPITVNQPNLVDYGQRYQYFLFDDEKTLSIFPFFPYQGKRGSHKIIAKIGLINDNELLKKLAKKESGSTEELINYAKANEGTTWSYSDSDAYDIDASNFSVINGAYYYIYTNYDNTEGYYRDLSDITVVMGENGMLVNDVDWDKLNKEEPETPTEQTIEKTTETKSTPQIEEKTESKKEEVKNPKTGIEKPYMGAIVFVLIAIIGLIIIKNKKIFSK